MKTFLDWSAYDTYGVGDAYAGIPATGGNYAKAVAVCMNNHQCQRDGKGVMCPSYRITHDPAHSTGARVKAFKAALNGELGDDPFAHPDLAAAMDLCVSCKGCKKECPSAVDMTLIKTEYLAHKNERLGLSRRIRLFAGLQHLDRRLGDFRRVVMGEGVDENGHFSASTVAFGIGGADRAGDELRNRPPGRNAQPALGQPGD